MKIKELFEDSNIDRKIEKVISYSANQEKNLKNEISEYIATDSIEKNFQTLLENMQNSLNDSDQNEIGVWVSGFYGSGKSSFTKYFGLSFDENCMVENVQFKDFFRDRLHTAQTKSLLNTISKQFPAEVIMIDLASSQITGHQMATISQVLFDTVLKKYGFSTNRKVFSLEKLLEKNNKFFEFKNEFKKKTNGEEWEDCNNELIYLDSVVPELASKFLPDIFSEISSFNTTTYNDISSFTDDDAREMIDIIRKKSGKENIIFILDEVGQYLGNEGGNLILNLDGLAKNLKQIGNGKVWLIATAQQTLTEDSSFVNRSDLFKLKDRFPIQIRLASNDINEIIQKRLLQKSTQGMEVCKDLFKKYGQKMIQNTKLDADYYENQYSINETNFCNFYPFFPAQFEILLQLLSALARATGGIGLRSAIKVVQEILNGGNNSDNGFGNQDIGWMANVVNLFDILQEDIYNSFHEKKVIMNLVQTEYHNNLLAQDIVKALIILDLIPGIKTTKSNLTALFYDNLKKDFDNQKIQKEIDKIIDNNSIPIKENNGEITFISSKLQKLNQEMDIIPTNSSEKKRTFNQIIKEILSPLEGNLIGDNNTNVKVKSGLQILDLYGNSILSTDGENHKIQTTIYFFEEGIYEQKKQELTTNSIQTVNNNLNVIVRKNSNFENLLNEINKRENLIHRFSNETDSELREHIKNLVNEKENFTRKLKTEITSQINSGSIIYNGSLTGIVELKKDLNQILTKAANDTYSKFSQASVQLHTNHAQNFLKASNNLNNIDFNLDPLNLIDKSTGDAEIATEKPCIVSIKDFLENSGRQDADIILKEFNNPPYYWSNDTTRYIIAAMFVGGQIEINFSGKIIQQVNQELLSIFNTNNTFKKCSIQLKNTEITNEQRRYAKDALILLTGRDVAATDNAIADAAYNFVINLKNDMSNLENKLKNIKIIKEESFKDISTYIENIIDDRSIAISMLGIRDGKPLQSFKWIKELQNKLVPEITSTIDLVNKKIENIQDKPNTMVFTKLKENIKPIIDDFELSKKQLKFWEEDFSSFKNNIDNFINHTCEELIEENKNLVGTYISSINQIQNINVINKEDTANKINEISKFTLDDDKIFNSKNDPLDKIRDINNNNQLISEKYSSVTFEIKEIINKIIEDNIKIEKGKNIDEYSSTETLLENITNFEDLETLINRLNKIKEISKTFKKLNIKFIIEDKD